MKNVTFLKFILTTASALVLTPLVLAQAPAAAAPAGGGGGRGNVVPGTPGLALPAIDLYSAVVRVPVLNDSDLTNVTRMEESVEVQTAAVAAARTALTRASLTVPANAADVAAKAAALGTAEQALATARSAAFAKLLTEIKATTPEKVAAVVATINLPGGPARGGAPAAAAPAAATAPARGN